MNLCRNLLFIFSLNLVIFFIPASSLGEDCIDVHRQDNQEVSNVYDSLKKWKLIPEELLNRCSQCDKSGQLTRISDSARKAIREKVIKKWYHQHLKHSDERTFLEELFKVGLGGNLNCYSSTRNYKVYWENGGPQNEGLDQYAPSGEKGKSLGTKGGAGSIAMEMRRMEYFCQKGGKEKIFASGLKVQETYQKRIRFAEWTIGDLEDVIREVNTSINNLKLESILGCEDFRKGIQVQIDELGTIKEEILRLKNSYVGRKASYQDLSNGALLQNRVCGESGRR